MKFSRDWFFLGLLTAVGLAALFPEPGASGGWMHPEAVTKAGVALIFFLHGLVLSWTALRSGALNWRLHLLVQSCTFGLFPLIGLGITAAFGAHLDADLSLGLFFLCALPSTVSSSVAMTASAQGNVAGAVFNATLSSLIGVVLTPLWLAWVMKASGLSQPIGPVVFDLFKWLIVPLALGRALCPWLGAWALRYKARIGVVDRCTILLLVYTSFCDAFKNRVWSSGSSGQIVLLLFICVALFALIMTLMTVAAKSLGMSRGDRIAAVFCGSKKTIASGVPMAKLIFGTHPGLGFILLPIMIYHPLQLLICGMLAQRWSKQG